MKLHEGERNKNGSSKASSTSARPKWRSYALSIWRWCSYQAFGIYGINFQIQTQQDIDRTFNAGSTQTWRKQPENACFLQSFARFQRSLLSHLFRFWTLYFLMTILWLLSKLAAPHHQWHFSACETSGLQALTFNVQRSTSTATSTLNTRQSTEASLGGFFGTIRRHPELVKSSKTSSKTMYLPISSESVSQYGSSKLHLNLLVICLWYWLTASSPTSG